MAGELQKLSERDPAAFSNEPSDHELVAGVRKGEGAAFEKLMRRYNQRVFRSARSILRDEAEAEDVVQETFVRAFRHIGDFKERSSVGTWLTRIAVNEALSRLRRSKRFAPLESEMNENEAGADSAASNLGPEEQASSGELRSVLTAAFDSLSPDLRTVFMLREIEGLSTADTSEALQLSDEAVRVRFHRARAALRKAVEKQVGNEVPALFSFAGERCDRTVSEVFRRLGLTLPD